MSNRPYGTGYYTKVQLVGDTDAVMDISDATLTNANQILANYVGYLQTGEKVTGTCDYDVNSSAPISGVELADASKILTGYGAYVSGSAVTGTMAQQSGITIDANTGSTVTAITQGFYPTGSNVTLTNVDSAKIVNGQTLFGVEGTGGGGTYQTKTITQSLTAQTVNPDTGYDAMTQVICNAVPQTTTQTTHGYCLTIG